MLRAALIGLGGITGSHRRGYANLEKKGIAKLVCACDINPKAIEKKLAINIDNGSTPWEEKFNFYTDLEEMLAKEEFDFVDICVPSFLHREMTVRMLERGYNVLCEKPMALNYEDCLAMIRASEKAGKHLMIGQCVRFYPAFDYVKEAIDEGRFGKLLGGFFSRLSGPPIWGWENWYMNPERSCGCINDLHIHDVDIIRYLFGEPDAVSCRASTSVCVHDTVHTSLFYGDTPVTAIGDWTLVGTKFEASCRMDFEKATVTYVGSTLTVYPKDGSASFAVPLENISGYEGEIAYFCRVVEGKCQNTKNPPTASAGTIRLIDEMRKSIAAGGAVVAVEKD